MKKPRQKAGAQYAGGKYAVCVHNGQVRFYRQPLRASVNWFTDGQKEVALARRKSGPDAPVRWTPAVEPFPQPVPESSRRPGRVGEVFAIAAGRVFLGSLPIPVIAGTTPPS
jgi:hypothetical protein